MMNKLAVQMFTVYKCIKDEETLIQAFEKISAIGYSAVQLSAIECINNGTIPPKRIKHLLDNHGLKCIATHRNFEQLRNNTDVEIDFHQILGCDYVAIGGIFGDKPYSQTPEGFRNFLSDARPVIKRLKEAGISFGYHNHDHELFRYLSDQPRLLDIIIDEGGDDLMLEMDLFWLWHGGESPAKMIRRGKGRVNVIHLKDKGRFNDPENPNGICAIGEGNMPWEEIIPACEDSGVEWYCIEQDYCARDPFDCLKSSYEYLSKFYLV